MVNEDKQNFDDGNLPRRKVGVDYKPVMLFYAKTTSWVIFPLVLCILLVKVAHLDQTLFFGIIMAGFGITCFGIYREIKQYKRELEKSPDHPDQNRDSDWGRRSRDPDTRSGKK